MEKNYVVATTELTKAYDHTTVVDHINLNIAEGEVFGLLGPNGAGKTTTILMLLGLTEPASGKAEVCGYNPTRQALQVKRIVGYMPEKVGFYDNLTARENLKFIAELNKIPQREINTKIDELLKAVGMSANADRKVGEYSRGMRQRLGIADALVKNPKLVILDEPTAGLDPEGINQINELIHGLPKRGTTVILSSHQLYQVQKICHSVAIIAKGKLVVEGKIADLSKKATGGRYQIEVETLDPTPELVEKIGNINGVFKVETKDNILLVSTTSDLRPELAKAVIDNNSPLIQMRILELTLDDIYMRYFKSEE